MRVRILNPKKVLEMLLSRPSKGPDFVEPEVELPPNDDGDDYLKIAPTSLNVDDGEPYSELPRSLNGPRNLTNIIV